MITIANRSVYKGDGIRIDRGTCVGNPFFMKNEGMRDEVCDKYETWLRKEYEKKGKVYNWLHTRAQEYAAGEDMVLICWCAPKRCHGDFLKHAIEELASNVYGESSGIVAVAKRCK